MVQQERAVRTRKSLLRAAAETFAEEGFAPATLSNISRKAGVSSGALHFHFENKHALAQAVETAAVDTVRWITRNTDERQASPLQRLVDATYGLMSSLEEDVVVRAGFELLGTAPRRDGAVDLRREWQHWIEAMLHASEEAGELAEGISPADASIAVVAATMGFEVLGVKDRNWVSRNTLCQYWKLMLPRLASPDRLAELVPHGTGSWRS